MNRILLWFVSVAAAIAACVITAFGALSQAIDFNAAYCILLARNLGEHFLYRLNDVGGAIYPLSVSANGPVQYFGGLGFALTRNIDGALLFGVVSSVLALLIAAMMIRPWFSAIVLLLLLSFPTITQRAIAFDGYIWAAACMLLAIHILERIRPATDWKAALRDRRVWLACLFFSLAAWSKLIDGFGSLAIVPCALFSQATTIRPKELLVNAWRTVLASPVLWCLIALAFFLEVTFAVVHTARSFSGLLEAPHYFWTFVRGDIRAGSAIIGSHAGVLAQYTWFEKFVTLAAVAVLVVRKPAYAVLAAVVAWFLFYVGMERHQLSSFYIVIVILAARETVAWFAAVATRREWPRAMREGSAAIAILAILLIGAAGAHTIPKDDPARQFGLQTSSGLYHYSPKLLEVLRAYPIVMTSGYWQMPEISSRWGFQFYDRLAPENASLWSKSPVLLIDSSNHSFPVTSVAANCGATIYVDGPIVVCHARPDAPLNYVEDTRLADWSGPTSTMDVSKSTWELTPGIRRVASAKTVSYVVEGGPALIRNDSASLIVDVIPGDSYVFSAQVDPSAISGGPNGQFDLSIGSTNGKSTLTNAFYPEGPPARYGTRLWTCPDGVTSVRLSMQVISTTVATGKTLSFSEPRFVRYSASAKLAPKP